MAYASLPPVLSLAILAVGNAEGWTAAEELSLVHHVKKMGLGAWEDIADSVSTRTSSVSVARHARFFSCLQCVSISVRCVVVPRQ